MSNHSRYTFRRNWAVGLVIAAYLLTLWLATGIFTGTDDFLYLGSPWPTILALVPLIILCGSICCNLVLDKQALAVAAMFCLGECFSALASLIQAFYVCGMGFNDDQQHTNQMMLARKVRVGCMLIANGSLLSAILWILTGMCTFFMDPPAGDNYHHVVVQAYEDQQDNEESLPQLRQDVIPATAQLETSDTTAEASLPSRKVG